MYILVNEDIKIGKGKLAGQVGHAVGSYFYYNHIFNSSNSEIFDEYMRIGQKKIILKCSESKLLELENDGYVSIRDKGWTQLEPNTLTCVNLGILDIEEVPEFIKELKLL